MLGVFECVRTVLAIGWDVGIPSSIFTATSDAWPVFPFSFWIFSWRGRTCSCHLSWFGSFLSILTITIISLFIFYSTALCALYGRTVSGLRITADKADLATVFPKHACFMS